jgi:hypothetical protein
LYLIIWKEINTKGAFTRMKTECKENELQFQDIEKKKVVADFQGGTITSDTGILFLRELEHTYKFIKRFSSCFSDYRKRDKIRYEVQDLITQRVFGICQGYEDLNDHDTLRNDPLFGLACERTERDKETEGYVSGKSTLNRLECSGKEIGNKERYKKISYDDEKAAESITEMSLDTVGEKPEEIILDFDSTDDPLHGKQEGRFFHGYYDCYCYLPLYVFWGEKLLACKLRPSNIDGSEGTVEELERIVTAIRKRWPDTRIVFRGDSGFCREKIMSWCDKNGVFYLIGLARNRRLQRMLGKDMDEAKKQFEASGKAQRVFGDFKYKTRKSWSRERRVVGKAEYLEKGANPRFVVTDLSLEEFPAAMLYEEVYCARGNMENRIKEQHLGLFADRTSSHTMRANQLRLYFSSIAYIFMNEVRNIGLKGTQYETAQCDTIRLKLLKVGSRITTSVRRICIHIATGFPYQDIYQKALRQIKNHRLCFEST